MGKFVQLGIAPGFRVLLIVGSLVFLGTILLLLKRGKLNVQYALIWIISGVVLTTFAIFPELVLHIRNLIGIEVVSNLVFFMLFGLVLILLLSLSTIVTGFARRIKRLTQTQSLLEKRVRELEDQLAPPPTGDSGAGGQNKGDS